MRTASDQRDDLGAIDDKQRLIERAQEGDRRAFEELILKYDRSILLLMLRLLGNREEAKDAYKETFLKVFRSIGQFRQQSSFYAWILSIAAHVCIDRLEQRQKSGRQATIDGKGSVGPTPLEEPVPASGCKNDRRPGLHAVRLRERVDRALAALSTRERLVFELKHYQGLKVKEIAEIVDTYENTIKDSLYSAIRKLRSALTNDTDCPAPSR